MQEAAYSLIPESERTAAHLRIGRSLLSHVSSEELEEKIFEIVNQLDRGIELIASLEERERVAELNLMAGIRAKASSAYASALRYLSVGGGLLAEDSWERRYELTFALEFHRAECEFVIGDLAAAEERLTTLSRRTGHVIDKSAVTCLRLDLYTTLDRSDRAVEVCLEYLRHFGVAWSPHPTEEEVRLEYERMWRQLGSRPIEALIDLPLMTDPGWRATMDVLAKVMPPALFTDRNLQCLVVGRMANLSLEHGNCDGSCLGYVWLGGVLGTYFGDYRAGSRFGKLSVHLVDKHGLNRFKARVYLGFGSLVNPWTGHLRTGLALMRRAFETAQKTGDLTYATYACYDLIGQLLPSGEPLSEVQREAENALELALKAQFGLMVHGIAGQLRLIRALRGLTAEFGSFNDDQFDEVQFEQHLESDARLANPAGRYWIRKLQARFHAGDNAVAIKAADKVQRLLWAVPPNIEVSDYHFHAALARAGHHEAISAGERFGHLQAIVAHYNQLTAWAENCPENFGDRAALVAAEIARLEGREFEAMRLYEEAIRLANENGFIQNAGIANEIAAQFCAARGFETMAHAYLRNARYCYLRWGADGKVKQLDKSHPHLCEEPAGLHPTTTIGAPVEQLDLATVVKMSQAVSSEILLEKLIETLMVIALEHTGAEHGLLVLPLCGEQRIEAEATTRGETVTVRLRRALVTSAELPVSVLRYVIRTQQPVILDDASVQNLFSADEYLRHAQSRSILCLPLLKQGKLTGVLYLENSLTPNVFTPDRLAVLGLLASQAAISLENARLYADLKQENSDRSKAEEALRASEEELRRIRRLEQEMHQASRTEMMGGLTASLAHELNQPLAAVRSNAEAARCFLSMERPDLDEVKAAIDDVLRDNDRAAETIRNVRALFRRDTVQNSLVDLREVLSDVERIVRADATLRNVTLRLHLETSLPPVIGNRTQLIEALINLVLNAFDSVCESADGPREVEVRASQRKEGHVHIAVRDSGKGIEPEVMPRLFDAFFTTKPKGMGMGLAIVRSIIESHGGRLWAARNPDRGATLEFDLPRARKNQA